jgi:membrane protease YdiL (CAAX protease family)
VHAAPSDPDPAPAAEPPASPALGRRIEHERLTAVLEVLICSGLPTQLVIGQLLAFAGFPPFGPDGAPRAVPVFVLTLADTVVLITLIAVLLHARGERLRDLIAGSRPVRRESALGVVLVPLLFVGVGVTVVLLRRFVPWTHNVPSNPFERLMQTPGDAGIFAIVVIVAGGLREEVQRAFLLTRFERWLGGPIVGLVLVSVAFGAGHILQGWDAAIVTGLLGAAWGVLYLLRRSAVAPIVSHAGYNAAQVLQAVAVQSLRA